MDEPWYKIGRLGVKRRVSGGNRNYIERCRTLKRRIQGLLLFPSPESKNVQRANKLKVFVLYYNNLKKHQGLGWQTPKEVLN